MTVRKEPKTASAVTRMFFERLDNADIQALELSRQCGAQTNTLYCWRHGKAAATVANMEAALAVLGLELVIQPIMKTKPKGTPAMSWKPEVLVDGNWSRNGLVFATQKEAEDNARDLMWRWWSVKDSRAVEVDEPVKNTNHDGQLTFDGQEA